MPSPHTQPECAPAQSLIDVILETVNRALADVDWIAPVVEQGRR